MAMHAEPAGPFGTKDEKVQEKGGGLGVSKRSGAGDSTSVAKC